MLRQNLGAKSLRESWPSAHIQQEIPLNRQARTAALGDFKVNDASGARVAVVVWPMRRAPTTAMVYTEPPLHRRSDV